MERLIVEHMIQILFFIQRPLVFPSFLENGHQRRLRTLEAQPTRIANPNVPTNKLQHGYVTRCPKVCDLDSTHLHTATIDLNLDNIITRIIVSPGPL